MVPSADNSTTNATSKIDSVLNEDDIVLVLICGLFQSCFFRKVIKIQSTAKTTRVSAKGKAGRSEAENEGLFHKVTQHTQIFEILKAAANLMNFSNF